MKKTTQKRAWGNFQVLVTVLCVIVAVASTAIVYSIQVNNLENQLGNRESARLVNVSLQYTDNRQGVIHVTGYVCNVGDATAYECQVQVDQYRNGEIMKTDRVDCGNIQGLASVYVDANVTYTGAPPANVTFALRWIQSWDIPIP